MKQLYWRTLSLLGLSVLLVGCTGRKEKIALCDTLYAPFEADGRYSVIENGSELTGGFHVSRSDLVTFDILSPEPYAGIRVESDGDGFSDAYRISYSDVAASVPRESLSAFAALLSLFETPLAACVEELPEKDFVPTEQDGTLGSVGFTRDGNVCTVIYDTESGIPSRLSLAGAAAEVSVAIDNWKRTDTDSETK